MTRRLILVGTGGFGALWCQKFLPPNVTDGLIEVVAAVDVNPAALRNARRYLGLRADQCYTDARLAMDAVRADACAIVVPPQFHEEIVDLALAHDLHILSEKPIADTLEAAVRIADKVQRAGKKMGVTMSHRFDQDKTTLRQELRSGRHGPLAYLAARFMWDARKFGVIGEWRHRMADVLLIEGAVHHLDILADLAGAPCEQIYAETWNAPWGEYAGDSSAFVTLRFANGVRAIYEGSMTNAVGINDWTREYIRAECERATLVLNRRRLEQFTYDPRRSFVSRGEGRGTRLPLLQQPKWMNTWLIEQFVHWLDGGEPMATNVADNLQAMALVAAAIASSRSGQPVRVQELLAQTSDHVRVGNGPAAHP